MTSTFPPRFSTTRKSARHWMTFAVGETGQKSIHPQYVPKIINELAGKDGIFTCDVGTPTIWAARYLTMNGKRRLLGSFSHGSMAVRFRRRLGHNLFTRIASHYLVRG